MSKRDLPQHVAIIMDGNGRGAKQKKLPRTPPPHLKQKREKGGGVKRRNDKGLAVKEII